MATNIADGTYTAVPDTAAVYEKNGKLVLELRFSLCDEEGNLYDCPKQSKRFWLTSADGVINQGVVTQIMKFAKDWDGSDPFWFTEGENFQSVGMVSVVLETRQYTGSDGQPHTWQEIKWVNVPRSGGGSKPIESGDKAAIMAKYGAKLKASASALGKAAIPTVSSRAPAKPAPAARAPAPAAPRRAAPPPANPAPASRMPGGLKGQEIAWNRYCESLPDGVDVAARDDGWFTILDQVAPDKDQQDFTGEEWEQVIAKIDVPAPADDAAVDPENMPF